MEIIETGIKDLVIIKPRVFADDRGYFYESYNKDKFAELGINAEFIQDNQSKSSYGVIRGLHFQKGDHAQAKLVRAVEGAVLDVAVDLRKDSPTYGKHYAIELTAENHLIFFIPRGFAHGFSVLSDTAIFSYKCDNAYNPESEGSLHPFSPKLNIDWRISKNKAVLSDKDQLALEF